MTAARVVSLVLGSALVATWLVSGAVTRRTDNQVLQPSRPRRPLAGAATAAPDLDVRRERLDARLEHITPPTRSPRNPFRFGSRESVPAPPRRQVEAASVAGADRAHAEEFGENRAPALRLVAIAEDRTPDGLVRLAAIALDGTVTLAQVGDELGGRYLVIAISHDVVELRDRVGGPPLRLALR